MGRSKYGINIQDHIRELKNNLLGKKYLNSSMRIRIWNLFDPRFGILGGKIRIRDIPDPQHCCSIYKCCDILATPVLRLLS
jgi:hypothetical protein